MGQNIVKGERMGLSPLAVSELAKEFRRLGRVSDHAVKLSNSEIERVIHFSVADTYYRAAQMLEEKLGK